MAVYDLEEQEQLDELKAWWRQYGNLVTTALTVVALALAGWQGWNWWQRAQHSEAAAIYGSLQEAAAQHDAKRARELAGMLIDQYGRTKYASMGALLSARAQVDGGDAKSAKLQLEWAADKSGDPALKELARLRLVGVLLDEKAYDDALARLSAAPAEGFEARYHDLRGDVLQAQGKSAEAQQSYAAAVAALDGQLKLAHDNEKRSLESLRELVQSKQTDAAAGAAK
jgi:predicted negative regulator of RcsB-dependent stress response